MGLVDPEAFDGHAVTLVYIAGRLNEGKRVEAVLSEHAIDYAVDAEPFENLLFGFIPVRYEGVGFYVRAEQAEVSRSLLRNARLMQGLVEADD